MHRANSTFPDPSGLVKNRRDISRSSSQKENHGPEEFIPFVESGILGISVGVNVGGGSVGCGVEVAVKTGCVVGDEVGINYVA